MTTASDLLNQNTGVPPTSPWATITGETAFNLGTSYAEPSSGSSDAGMYYSTLVGANQFSRALVVDYGADTTPGGGAGIGVAVRMSTSAETQIRAVINAAATNNVALQQLKAGVFTQLAVATMAFVKGTDFIELDVTGANATVIKNATPITGLTNIAFDATIASGSPGIAYSSDSSGARVSTWSGGDLAGGVGGFPPVPDKRPAGMPPSAILSMRGRQRPPMHCSREFEREGRMLVPSRTIFLPSHTRNQQHASRDS